MHGSIATGNGNRIAECREKAGLGRERLAAQLDVNSSTIYRWERTGNLPTLKLRALADLLEVDPLYLMGWER